LGLGGAAGFKYLSEQIKQSLQRSFFPCLFHWRGFESMGQIGAGAIENKIQALPNLAIAEYGQILARLLAQALDEYEGGKGIFGIEYVGFILRHPVPGRFGDGAVKDVVELGGVWA
jgi:hypothetical protein